MLIKMDKCRGMAKNGYWPGGQLKERPSNIFKRHVSVVAYPEDDLKTIIDQVGSHEWMIMGSDYPHAEGVPTPRDFADEACKALTRRADAGRDARQRPALPGARGLTRSHEDARRPSCSASRYPIVQSGMRWVSRAELVVGGLERRRASASCRRTPSPMREALRREIERTRSLTEQPFGVNLTLLPGASGVDVEGYVRVVCEERIPVVETAGGSPARYLDALKGGRRQGDAQGHQRAPCAEGAVARRRCGDHRRLRMRRPSGRRTTCRAWC